MSDGTTTYTPLSPSLADVMEEVDRKLGLIQWIEDARTTLAQLWEHARHDKVLSAALSKNEVQMGLEWSETESSALQDMFLEMRVRMGKLQLGSEQGASHV